MPTPRVIAVLPAHNEADRIEAAIASVIDQVDDVVVVSDNCTDDTEPLALAAGARVFRTSGNTAKKAGALNQALRWITPVLAWSDRVLIMDSDSTIAPHFAAVAGRTLDREQDCGAVGGIFRGEPGPRGLLAELQRNEYERYSREIARRRGRAWVLSGTATLWQLATLANIARGRGSALPGRRGDFYNEDALTEDNEITFAAKTLGYRCLSPAVCEVRTELMASWGALWRQRVRWERGALDNLGHYGVTRPALPYWGQQAGLIAGALVMWLYVALTVMASIAGGLGWSWFWAGVGGVFVVERVATVWRRGWTGRLLALAMVPEIAYDMFQQLILAAALIGKASGKAGAWHHAAPRTIAAVAA